MKPGTEHDYHKRIARAVEAILIAPAEPHTVESLASVACFSPFHFHRIYRALTGESVAETIRRVRLAQAAGRLANASDTVTTIALDVGYDSPQAFARAFRAFTGVSPGEFRDRQSVVPPVEMVDLLSIDTICLLHEGKVTTIGRTYRARHQASASPIF